MKHKKGLGMRLAVLFSAVLMLFSTVVAACSPATPPDGDTVAVKSVEITYGSRLELSVGETKKLTAKVKPLNATDKSVSWASSDTAVATVNAEGTVSALEEGTATVTVTTTDGEFTDEIEVVVVEGSDDPTNPDGDNVAVTGVTLNKSTHSMEVGGTFSLVATVAPANATNKAVTWKTNAAARATVDENGVVTAKTKGKVIVTATTVDGQFEAKCTITISVAAAPTVVKVTSVTLNKGTLALTSGTQETLTATVMPANADEKSVTWESSNYTVASVNGGAVLGIYEGTATITARTVDGGFIAECTVTVTQAADGTGVRPDPDNPTPVEYDYPGQPEWSETQEMTLGLHYNNGYMNNVRGVDSKNYDASVFRVNESQNPVSADPMVLYISQESSPYYGKYVQYGTFATSSFQCYVSDDLVNWEFGGLCFMPHAKSWGVDTLWAPECTFDPTTNLYYFFYSANNRYDQKEHIYNTVQNWYVQLNVAVSESPVGPFIEYNEYELRQQCKAEGREPSEEEIIDAVSKPRFDWRQFLANDAEKEENDMDYFTSIDSSPFYDPQTGERYLTFVRDRCGAQDDGNHTWPHLIHMTDWATPDYSTLTKMIGTDDGGYEIPNNNICEGPSLHYREENDTYYVIFSANSYRNSSYCAAQAIWEANGGDLSDFVSNKANRFTKIKMEKGGLLVYANDTDQASGTGHGVLLRVGEDQALYYAYHRHSNQHSGTREYAIDEINWITVDGQDVMHLNGCSATLMPAILGEYANIAHDAKVTATSGTGLEAINDDLVNMHNESNGGLWDWIPSFSTSAQSTTITMKFDEWRSVAGFIVYNSREKANVFTSIKKVEMKAMMNGRETTVVINNLAVDPNTTGKKVGSLQMPYVMLGTGAYASFEELIINEISFTVEKPSDKDVHIMDIAILGRYEVADPTFVDETNPKGSLKMHRYDRPRSSNLNIPENDPVYVDGEIDEFYGEQNWFDYTTRLYSDNMGEAKAIGQMGSSVRGTVVYGKDGFYTIFEVKNTTVYIDDTYMARGTYLNSGVELYINFSNKVAEGDTRPYEVDLDANGHVNIKKSYLNGLGKDATYSYPALGCVSIGVVFDDEGNPAQINTPEASGYLIETYFPWDIFDVDIPPASIKMDVALVASGSKEDSKRIGWYSFVEAETGVDAWVQSDKHWDWGTTGFQGGKVDVEIADYDTDMGTVTASAMQFDINGSTTITVAPKTGYQLTRLLVDGVDVTDQLVEGAITFTNYLGRQKMLVQAEFEVDGE